jgi:hypothetical protein
VALGAAGWRCQQHAVMPVLGAAGRRRHQQPVLPPPARQSIASNQIKGPQKVTPQAACIAHERLHSQVTVRLGQAPAIRIAAQYPHHLPHKSSRGLSTRSPYSLICIGVWCCLLLWCLLGRAAGARYYRDLFGPYLHKPGQNIRTEDAATNSFLHKVSVW